VISYGVHCGSELERNPPPIPPELLVQARVAARNGIGLNTVLRRYFAGYALLGDFLIEEAHERVQGIALKRLLRLQASLFDGVIAVVSEEHRRDQQRHLETNDQAGAQIAGASRIRPRPSNLP
jgi:hypothetical protein